ncbi:ATP-binding protein [Roseivirga sp.]|uniref:sensor histidine kinase n=1 Tax=Roseivirga sp. TaxID=1964215 RepID=UPI003B8D88E6
MAKKNSVNGGVSLFWKLSATFLVLLIMVGAVHITLSISASDQYYLERNQKLNAGIAQSIIQEVKPIINGEVTANALDDIMHHMMAVNPSIEVYLLDKTGYILSHVAPYKKVKLKTVNLEPIQAFIDASGEEFVQGDDPRKPGELQIFSAAAITDNDQLQGYVYVVLAGEEYYAVASNLWNEYITSLGGSSMLITLFAALFIGLIAIWFITRNLRGIIDAVRRFQEGDLDARISAKSGKEFNTLSMAFNDMADTIVGNIENLKSMENLRRELVGNVSHDLRTPLAVIHGYIETLMIKKDDLSIEERDKYLNIILSSTEKLKKMVAELFELSKLESKQVHPKKEPFFINELLQDVVQKYLILARKKGVLIQSVISNNIELVNADIALIERVLQNLIDNALKFTPEGGTITIKTNEMDSAVEIQVSDTGVGIPEEQIPFVFDRYHIGDKRLSLDKNNTGLGLAIVQKILEIHDATINLTSKLNKGTSFSFQLPYHQA